MRRAVFAALAFAVTPSLAAAAPPRVTTLPPQQVLARYERALDKLREPAWISFDYLLTQGGTRSAEQAHRVVRHGSEERDETLDPQAGKVVVTRIFHGRRNRYTAGALAPRAKGYTFAFVGIVRDARHFDYVFATIPRAPGPFAVTRVTIDGVRFLPAHVSFATREHGGRGTVDFASRDRWWVVTAAQASAHEGDGVATERIAFSVYRFPARLPPSTFAAPRPLPTATPPP